MAEPKDGWVDVPENDGWVDVPEGGSGGGIPDNSAPKPLLKAEPVEPPDPEKEKREKGDAMAALYHGQGTPPEAAEERSNREQAGALGTLIAGARGTPLVGSHIDELSALLQAHAATGPKYDAKVKEARGAVDQAVRDNPRAPALASLAFAPAAPATALGRIGLSAAEGLSEGIGNAKSMSEAPREGAIGAGVGLAGGLAGEAINQGGQYFAGKRADVLANNRAVTDKGIDKSVRSAIGTVGNKEAEAAQALRTLEERANATTGDPAVRNAARQALDSDYANQLRDQIARGYLRRWEGLGPAISGAREEMGNVIAGASPEARMAAAQARLDDPSALLRRVRELGPKVVLPAVGAAVGGPFGAMAGAGSAAVLGRSGTTVRNAMMDPYVASRVLGLGSAALGGAGRAMQAESPIMSKATLDAADGRAPWEEFLKKDEEKP